ASFPPGGLIGLRLNPDTTQAYGFTVIDNTATTLVTEPTDGDMTSVASVGSDYTATPTVGHFAVQGGATVELVDADFAHADRKGRLRANSCDILTASVVTHPASTTTTQFGMELIVDNRLLIDGTSRIDVSALGYLGSGNGGLGDQ